jgi:hypothetical protein
LISDDCSGRRSSPSNSVEGHDEGAGGARLGIHSSIVVAALVEAVMGERVWHVQHSLSRDEKMMREMWRLRPSPMASLATNTLKPLLESAGGE